MFLNNPILVHNRSLVMFKNTFIDTFAKHPSFSQYKEGQRYFTESLPEQNHLQSAYLMWTVGPSLTLLALPYSYLNMYFHLSF